MLCYDLSHVTCHLSILIVGHPIQEADKVKHFELVLMNACMAHGFNLQSSAGKIKGFLFQYALECPRHFNKTSRRMPITEAEEPGECHQFLHLSSIPCILYCDCCERLFFQL